MRIITCLVFALCLFTCNSNNDDPIFPNPDGPTSQNIKVMMFNVFGGFPRGSDRNNVNHYGLDAIIETIKNSEAEIIGLNEISVNQKAATNFDDQPKLIAEALGYHYDFYGLEVSGKYGVALVSKYPILETKHVQFEIQGSTLKGMIQAKVEHPDGDLWVYVTHLDSSDELARHYQVRQLKKHAKALGNVPKLLLGDLNFTPDSENHDELTVIDTEFIDPLGKSLTPNTFSLNNPKRIDYIMGNAYLNFVEIPWSDTTDKTSDHFPVWAHINFFLN